ncbi:unnamed protein product [Debaryomyces tyrocola]|nr:unnamed protein product [Debaryomyces tyrocola]
MEGLELDSTHELLNRYKVKEGRNEDITIYSDEDSIFNSPSIELGRSAVKNTKNSSPFKKFGMGRSSSLSPSKKVRNDYQDHLHRMRGNSNTGSPLKRNNYDLSENNDFDDIKGMSELNIDSLSGSDNTMDREIQRILDMSSLKLPELQGDHGKDRTELLIKETHKLINTVPASITSSKEGEAYQKMLTTSLNKLIKQVESMKRDLENRDNEAKNHRTQLSNLEMKVGLYQRENSDLKKELSQVKKRSVTPQNDSRENDLLRTKLIKYRNLYTEADRENQELKSKHSGEPMKSEHASQQTPVREQPRPTNQANVAEIPSEIEIPIARKSLLQDAYKQRLVELQNQLSDIIDDVKDEPPKPEVQPVLEPKHQPHQTSESSEMPDAHSQPSLRMLAIFEDLVRAMKNESDESKYVEKPMETQPVPNETSANESVEKELVENQRNPIDPVLEKILTSLDKNNQMYNKLLDVLNPDANGQHVRISEPSTAPALDEVHYSDHKEREKEFVFQCYVCCPQNHKLHAKRPCKRCSAASSEASGSAGNSVTHSAGNSASDTTSDTHVRDGGPPNRMADFSDPKDNKTINLMGEYKWTI